MAASPMAFPPTRAEGAWDMDGTLCMVKRDRPAAELQSRGNRSMATAWLQSTNLGRPKSMTGISDGERDARQNLGLSHPSWKENEQDDEDIEGDDEEQEDQEDGEDEENKINEQDKEHEEQRFRPADTDNNDEDIGPVTDDYLDSLSHAEAGLLTFLSSPRILRCYVGQGYEDRVGVLDLGGLGWETAMEEWNLMNEY